LSQTAGREPDAASRLAELKDRVERATKLIAELREANYALKGELADLKRQVLSHEGGRSERSELTAASTAAAPALAAGGHEELQTLRDERKIIRAKVQNLLERIEKIDL
jgi:hypothetical protein